MNNPVIDNLLMDPRGSTVQIQDNYYEFNITLTNSDGDVVGIRHGAIKDFVFTEDLRFFYNYGYLIFDNTLDVLESTESISTDFDGTPQKAFSPFNFRNDGRDFLSVSITPQVMYENDSVGDTSTRKKKPFSLKGVFTIYDTEDIIIQDNKNTKLKKLYFRDVAYQLLKEKDSYFSTGRLKKGISNTDRSILTGEALRALLQQSLQSETKINQVFSENWDLGSQKIFYSSPPNNKVIDDIQYLLKFHVSDEQNNYCPAILRHDRNGKWTFAPLKQIQNGSYYKGTPQLGDLGGTGLIENFIIVRPNAGEPSPLGNPSRIPGVSPFANSFADYSYAENFQTSNMNVDDMQGGMLTTVAHNYDFGAGQFNMDMAENSIEAINKTGSNMFVQNQKGIGNKAPSTNLTTNLMRTQNRNVRHEYSVSTNPQQRFNVSRNQSMLLQFFNNQTVSFTARGKTDRTVGKFVTFSRTDNANENKFDNHLLGSYCIVKIDHSFVNNQYINEIVAVKNYDSANNNYSANVV